MKNITRISCRLKLSLRNENKMKFSFLSFYCILLYKIKATNCRKCYYTTLENILSSKPKKRYLYSNFHDECNRHVTENSIIDQQRAILSKRQLWNRLKQFKTMTNYFDKVYKKNCCICQIFDRIVFWIDIYVMLGWVWGLEVGVKLSLFTVLKTRKLFF